VDGTLFSMPLEVSDIMMHDDSYDKVGNFFIESSGQNVFEVFDNDDLIVKDGSVVNMFARDYKVG